MPERRYTLEMKEDNCTMEARAGAMEARVLPARAGDMEARAGARVINGSEWMQSYKMELVGVASEESLNCPAYLSTILDSARLGRTLSSTRSRSLQQLPKVLASSFFLSYSK